VRAFIARQAAMSTVYRWTIEEYEALGEAAQRIFDWRHPRHIELIRGYLKENGEPAKLSVGEYLNMVEAGIFSRFGKKTRVELLRGEIRDMSPIGNPHEQALTNLTEWSFAQAGKSVTIRVQCSVQLPPAGSVPEPDLVWAVRRSYRCEKPGPDDILLLIEVADTSLAEDTGEKAQIYAAAGIRDYWVVNIPDEVIEVRRDPGPEGYRSLAKFSGNQELRPLAFPEAVLIPDTVWE
jgi:Uma2 family endonuclease